MALPPISLAFAPAPNSDAPLDPERLSVTLDVPTVVSLVRLDTGEAVPSGRFVGTVDTLTTRSLDDVVVQVRGRR